MPESWMHLEILPPPRPDGRDSLVSNLEQGLLEVLRLVEEAVEDWQKMITRSEETIEMLKDPAFIGGHEDQADLACELLSWLNANHFTFLGYREYEVLRDQSGFQFKVRPVTGLGILRADQDPPGTFHAAPLPHVEPELMIITKDNQKSRVHRPAHLDYIGFRIFDAEHQVIGERRFLGLFSSSAYSESVARVPVLRQKAAAVIARSGYGEDSHGGKAIMDVLEGYPRDELFQTPLAELASIVEKVAHLKERRQVRMFVRRDPYGRFSPAWSFCRGTAIRPRYASGWRTSCCVVSADPRSSIRRASVSRCSPGFSSWFGCQPAKPWARSTYVPWSAN